MQPSGTRINPALGARSSSFSLVNSLDAIKQGFESMQTELNLVRNQRDELESKVNSQVVEVNSIRQSLFELETRHKQVCSQYEQEIKRLQEELRLTRVESPSVVRGPSPRVLGKSDAPPNFMASSSADSRPHGLRLLDPSRLSNERDRDPSTSERDMRAKIVRGDWDRERDADPRNAKRRKASDQSESQLVPMGSRHSMHSEPSSAMPPLAQNSYHSAHGSDAASATPSTPLPPMRLMPLSSTPEDWTFNVPSDCIKEGPDWYAVFVPQTKRSLDVHLLHTFHHSSVVCSIQFSPDGRFVATGSNRTAQIFDVQSGAKLCTLQDELAPKSGDLYIRSVRFSPDGKLLATGAEDFKIRVWDIASRRIIHIFEGHKQEIYSVDFSPDSRCIVSGSGDSTTRIWNLVDNSCKTFVISEANAVTEDAGVTSVAISPNGHLVAAGSLDSIVRIWDVASGALVERLTKHSMSVYSVSFTPDGRGILTASLDCQVKLWDISGPVDSFFRNHDRIPAMSSLTSSPHSTDMSFIGHKDFVLTVSMSADERWIVSGSKDRTVHFWDSRSGALHFVLQGHKNSVISTDFNPLGGMFATGSGDHTARIWTYSAISAV